MKFLAKFFEQQRAGKFSFLPWAVLLPLSALGLQWVFWAQLQPYVWFLFFPAVFFSSWLGGLRGGLVATGLSTLLVWYFFIPPTFSFLIEKPSSLVSMSLFVFMGFLFSMSHEKLRQLSRAAAETDFQDLFEQAAAGMSQVALDGRWLRVNQRLCEIVGYSRAELLQMTFQEITHPEDLVTDLAQVQKLLSGELKTYSLEKRYIRKDGGIVFANLTVAVSRVATGLPQHFISVVEDITLRKQAERALRESNERFSGIFDYTPVATSLSSVPEGRYLDVNNAWLNMFGWTREEVVGHTVFELNIWVDSARRAELFAEFKAHGAVRDFEMQLRTKSGAVRNILWAGKQVVIGGQTCLLGSAQDITERKQAESALQASEEFKEGVLDSVMAQIAVLDQDGVILAVNARWLQFGRENAGDILDLGRQVGVGANYLEVCRQVTGVSATGAQLIYDGIQAVLAGKQATFSHEYRCDSPQEQRWFSMVVTPMGKARRAVVISHTNITERRRAEAALERSHQQYRHAITAANAIPYQKDYATDTYVFMGDGIKDLTGYAPAELRSSIWQEIILETIFIGEAAGLESAEVFRRIFNGELKGWQTDHRIRTRSGEIRWISDSSVSLQNAAGRYIGSIGIIQDITERRRSAEALQESQALYHSLVTQLPIGIFQKDFAGRYVLVNPEFCRLKGMLAEDFLGKTPQEVSVSAEPQFADPGLADKYAVSGQEHHELILQTGKSLELDEEYTLPDGRKYFVHVMKFPVLNPAGKVSGTQGVLINITQRKQVEQALAENQRFLADVVENSGTLIFIKNRAGHYLLVNRRWEEVTGLRRELVLGQTDEALFPAPDGLHFRANDLAVMAAGKVLETEEVLVTERGQRFFISIKFPTRNEAGEVTGICGMTTEITERKQAETALVASEERFRKLVETAPEAIFIQTGGCFAYVNHAALKLFGATSPEELLGQPVLDRVHPDYQARTRARIQSLNEQYEAVGSMDSIFLTVAGELRNVVTSGVPFNHHQQNGALVFARDITERTRAEESFTRLATAVDQAVENIVITDLRGRIVYVNPAFEKTSGYTSAEAIGKTPRILKSGRQSLEFYQRLWSVIGGGETWSGHFTNQRKDGSLYEEDATITPIRDATGKLINFVAVKRDVTREMQLENQFRQAQKMEAIGTLAGGIAHDFNNILAAVFGYCYLLQQDVEQLPEAQENVEEILRAATRAKDLVTQILTFSRQREQKREVIRLENVVKEATKFLRASLPANIKINLNLSPEAPAVLADPTQIYQVTMNLATNALHAMEGLSGCLTIALDTFVPDLDWLQAQPEFRALPYTRLTVADTGQGMDAPTLQRIFEPFFTTKPLGKGTGLGLSVVHGIIQTHEAIIKVESQLGTGTTFRIYFPAQVEDPGPTVAETADILRGQGQRLLLLDDETALTVMFKRLLARLNYQVTTSNSPFEALELFRKTPDQFEVVITDLTMPEMNGLEVARKIHQVKPGLPIILVSGFTASLNEQDLHKAGISERIEKPVSLASLGEALQRVLGGSGPKQET